LVVKFEFTFILLYQPASSLGPYTTAGHCGGHVTNVMVKQSRVEHVGLQVSGGRVKASKAVTASYIHLFSRCCTWWY